MGAIGIVPEIIVFVVGVGIVGYALSYPKLHQPPKEVKVIMGINTIIIPQGAIIHVLIDERCPDIGIIEFFLPSFIPIRFSVIAQYNSGRMVRNKMRYIGIMEQYRTIKLVKVHRIFFDFSTVLGKADRTYK